MNVLQGERTVGDLTTGQPSLMTQSMMTPPVMTQPVVTPPVMTPPVLTPPPSSQNSASACPTGPPSGPPPPNSMFFNNSPLDFQSMMGPLNNFNMQGNHPHQMNNENNNISVESRVDDNSKSDEQKNSIGNESSRQEANFRWSNGFDIPRENNFQQWQTRETNSEIHKNNFSDWNDKKLEVLNNKTDPVKNELNTKDTSDISPSGNSPFSMENIKNSSDEQCLEDPFDISIAPHNMDGFNEQRWRVWARYLAQNMMNQSNNASPTPPKNPSTLNENLNLLENKTRQDEKGIVTPPDEKCHNSLWCKRRPSFSDDFFSQKIAKLNDKVKSSVEIKEINHNKPNNHSYYSYNKNIYNSLHCNMNSKDPQKDFSNELGRKLNLDIGPDNNREFPFGYNQSLPCNLNQDLVRGLARDLNRDLSRDIKRQLHRESSNCGLLSRDIHREMGLDLRFRPQPEIMNSTYQQGKYKLFHMYHKVKWARVLIRNKNHQEKIKEDEM